MESVGTLYVHRVDADDVLTFPGAEWQDFARANGAPGLAEVEGRSLWDFVVGADVVVSCRWCRRFRLESGWVEAEEAIRELGLFGGVPAPRSSHGICEDCAARLSAGSAGGK